MSHLSDSRRHNVITASIAWSAVYERQKLWRQMTLREPPFEGNDMTEYGNIHESIALSALEKEFDDIVRKEGLKQALAWRDARFEESLEAKHVKQGEKGKGK